VRQAFRQYLECGIFGAVVVIHRVDSSLNEHVHFHVHVVDGVFEEVAGVIFQPATGMDADAVVQVQAALLRRILRACVGRGLLENCDAKDLLAYNRPPDYEVDQRDNW
jgi:hypothetical protein